MKRRAMWPLFLVVLGLFLAACGGGSGGSGGYTVSGTILDAEEQPLAGVTLTFSDMTATAETDEEGKWSQTGLKGSVTVTPVLDGHVFEPGSVDVSKTAADVDFVGKTSSKEDPKPTDPEPEPSYVVSGAITDEGDNPVADVTLEFSGLDTTAATDEDGEWTSPELQGEVTVTPRLTGYKFDPKEYTVSAASDALHFEATVVHPVSGIVEDEDGLPVGDVTISLRSVDGGETRKVTTRPDGTWRVDDVVGAVTVRASDPAYVFDEAERTVSGEADDVDFKGTLQACSTGYPNSDALCVLTRIKQVQRIEDNLEGHYALGADIDASETFHWNDDKGFQPIGVFKDEPFEGTFTGDGHVINELYINRPDEEFVGLFSHVGADGTLTDVHIASGSLVGGEYTGAIAGVSTGNVDRATNHAFVGSPENHIGGIVAVNEGNIVNSTNFGHVEGLRLVAGIAAANTGTIENSYNDISASVTAIFGGAGGLVGWNSSEGGGGAIRNSDNSGSVMANSGAGGISAVNEGVISDSDNFGDVTVTVSSAGGIAADSTGRVEHVENYGTVTAYGRFDDIPTSAEDELHLAMLAVGGIAGRATSTVTNAANFGDVIAERDAEDVGGLVGLLDEGTVTLSYNIAPITSDGDNVGGLVGSAIDGAEVKYSFNEGDVDAGGDRVGGLAGRSFASEIHNSYNHGTVRGQDDVGGLIGESDDGAELVRSYSAGGLRSRVLDSRGGLIGKAGSTTVRASFFDKDKAAPVNVADGETSTDDMKKQSTFVAEGWDFHETWEIDEGFDYPVLQKNRP